MIPPKPYKMICPKCGYSVIVKPKGDVLDIKDLIKKCPQCNTKMKRDEA